MKKKKKTLIYPFLAILITWIIVIFLPFYDSYNGFYLPFFPKWKSNFISSENAVIFSLIQKCLENKSLYFLKNETITTQQLPVKRLPDLIKVNDTFKPGFPTYAIEAYCQILKPLHPANEGYLFFYIMLLNLFLLSFIEVCFFWILMKLGLSPFSAFVFTVLFIISSGFLIYVRYMFLLTWIFAAFTIFSFLFLFFEKKWWKKLIGIELLLLGSMLSTFHLINWFVVPFIASLALFFTERQKMHPALSVLIIILLVFSAYVYLRHNEKRILPYLNRTYTPVDLKNFGLFSNQKESITPGVYPTIPYYFLSYPRNAVYMPGVYAFFYHLFSERGIIMNSPYLIFSLGGFLLLYKKKKKIVLYLGYFALFYLLLFSIYPVWFGGGSPRYDRYMLPLEFILGVFSFYYLESLIKRRKWVISSVFILLLVLSILNIISLSIRRDWVYVSDYKLFSYDLVLWPWTPTGEKIVFNLQNPSEQSQWLSTGIHGCSAAYDPRGIITDNCYCIGKSEAKKVVLIPMNWPEIRISFYACTDNAGGDFVEGIIKTKIDKKEISKMFLIPSRRCTSFEFELKIPTNKHLIGITLTTEKYKKCHEEWVIWKNITISKV